VKWQIIVQFLTEIFIQCLLALLASIYLVSISAPYFSELLQVSLLLSGIDIQIIIQLFFVLLTITLLAGIYPSLLLAGFKPAEVLSGRQNSRGKSRYNIRGIITVFQFTFAVIFVILLIVINQQVKYMQTQEPGFKAKQVVYINNLTIFDQTSKFEFLRNKIKSIPGVEYVTAASNIPGGVKPVSYEYRIKDNLVALSTIGVDYEYFETLSIQLKAGRFFTSLFKGDSTVAIINEAAEKAMGLPNPIGTTARGCNGSYPIVGVVHDVKAYGFEESVQPTIYLLNNSCNIQNLQIMINVRAEYMKALITTLDQNWHEINKLDGENFNYHFLDELYAQVYQKQEQLQTVLLYFSILAIFIAAIGIFASAAHDMRIRMKEIAIRKVLGAENTNLLLLLNKPFFVMIMLANLIAGPVSFIIINKWLATFAYRINLSSSPFIIASSISFVIVFCTVVLQTIRVIQDKSVSRLKE
jgi:putative ABC transport system permease protein